MALLKTLTVEGAAIAQTAPGSPEGVARKSDVDALGGLVAVPAAPGSTGVAGQKAADGAYDYLCRATNVWVRGPKVSGWSAATVPSAGKIHFAIGTGGAAWNETLLAVANDSVLATDGAGALQMVAKSTFASASGLSTHLADVANPHSVTKTQVGLPNVTNVEQLPLSYLDTNAALTADSDSKVPSQKAVKAFVAAQITSTLVGVMKFKGVIDCSANPNYPAGVIGDVYRISVAGLIGGGAGIAVDIGDTVYCIANNAGGNQATVGASWQIEEKNLADMTAQGANLLALPEPDDDSFLMFINSSAPVYKSGVEVLDYIGASRRYVGIRDIPGDYSFDVGDDLSQYFRTTGGGAQLFNVQADATVELPVGSQLPISRKAGGSVTFVPSVGVTFNYDSATFALTIAPGGVVVLVKVAADTWDVNGALELL